jgi:mono/diheme cytochrome c family protein
MFNIILLSALLLLAGFLIFLPFRLKRSPKIWIKWPGMLFSGLFGLILLTISVVAWIGLYKLNVPPYQYTLAEVQVAGTTEQLVRGEQLAYLCIDCHSSTGELPLDGSKDNLVTKEVPIGVLYATNLTPSGYLIDWTDGEIIRAIREGVDKNGRPLIGMTSEPFSHLSDADVHALIAYLRSQPAVKRDLPQRDLNILGALLVGANLAPTSAQPPITGEIITPFANTVDYGQYLVYTSGCRDCHGLDLTGPPNPFVPPGPNLINAMPNWNEEQFMTFLRSGVNNYGRTVDAKQMPWTSYSRAFSDADMRDMYTFLSELPAVVTSK